MSDEYIIFRPCYLFRAQTASKQVTYLV